MNTIKSISIKPILKVILVLVFTVFNSCIDMKDQTEEMIKLDRINLNKNLKN